MGEGPVGSLGPGRRSQKMENSIALTVMFLAGYSLLSIAYAIELFSRYGII